KVFILTQPFKKEIMKAMFFILAVSITTGLFAQQANGVIDLKPHKIVMQFTDSDSLSQASVVGQVKNIRTAWPNAQIEVVCHGPGLDLLISKTSKASAQVAEWSSKGVVFGACSNTMRRKNLKAEDLLKVSTVVPSAMIELTLKQEDGWAYVKGGH
ncbi:MAG TPA: DsrE family protein, partial [Cyclobacteriaceae bacterium]|nr:DsrE family protein [Cyclobacteriaceae bacterium]